jgi:hypothetical protein
MRQKYTGVDRNAMAFLPTDFILEQNYPNPFNSQTIIRYYLIKAGYVELAIYNILGRRLVTLVNEKQASGSHRVYFNKKNLNSGIYFTVLTVNGNKKIGKIALLK